MIGSHDDVIVMIKLISKKRERKMTGVVSSRPSKTSTKSMARSAIDVGLLLCVPFACSIGGTGTLTGTDLNLYLQGFHQDNFRTYTNGNVTWENDAKGRLKFRKKILRVGRSVEKLLSCSKNQ